MSAAQALRVLPIADEPTEGEALRHYTADNPLYPLTLEHVNHLEDACARLATGGIDAIMLRLGDTSPAGLTEQLQSITRLRNAGAGTPVVVLTDHEPDEHAVNTILQSANDCLVKNQLSPQVLIRVLRVAQRLQQQILNVLSASPDGMVVVDYEGIVLYANQASASMFERSTEELQGKPFGYPMADADKTEMDFGSVQSAEMRVVDVE
jgi:PAS domain-containing protein